MTWKGPRRNSDRLSHISGGIKDSTWILFRQQPGDRSEKVDSRRQTKAQSAGYWQRLVSDHEAGKDPWQTLLGQRAGNAHHSLIRSRSSDSEAKTVLTFAGDERYRATVSLGHGHFYSLEYANQATISHTLLKPLIHLVTRKT